MAGANSIVPGAYNTGVYFEVGGRVFSWDDPDHMVSLNVIKQVENTVLNFTMEVYDETCIDVEEAIFSVGMEGPFYLQYGYSEVDLRSKRYKVMVKKVLPSFDITGTTLTIEGTAWIENESKMRTVTSSTVPNSNIGKTYYGNPDEIFSEVAKEEGWIVRQVVPCMPLYPDGYVDSTTKWSAFRPSNMSAHVFIDEKVAPQAIDHMGRGSYKCILDIDGDDTRAWFIPREEDSEMPHQDYNYTVGYPDNKIIRWTPSSNGVVYHCGASNLECSSIDTKTGETHTSTIVTDPSRATIHVPISSCNKEELENRAKALCSEAITEMCTADLEVVGDPSLVVGTYVNMTVYTSHGNMHRSSGKYWIQSIEDIIEMGKYTSIMSMQKMENATYSSLTTSKARGGSGGGVVATSPRASASFGSIVSKGSKYSVGKNKMKSYTQGESLGSFTITAYCPCKICCGNYSYEVTGKQNHTGYTGDIPSEGRTIAVDGSKIEPGTWVCWDDPKTGRTELRRAEDKGGGINGNHIDLYFENHQDAVNYGTQHADLYKASETKKDSNLNKLPTDVQKKLRGDGKFASAEIAAVAQAYLGTPYVYGAEDGDFSCFDCSSLVKQLSLDLGYSGEDFTSYTGTMINMGEAVDVSDRSSWQPGDWVFTNSGGHVGMYVGDGQWVAASSGKGEVTYQDITNRDVVAVRRVL